jgi:hypothetical protein
MSPESPMPQTTSRTKNGTDSPSVVRTLKSSKFDLTTAATCGLLVFAALSIGGQMGTQRATNETLKLCNQNVGECVFKYDILMYNETGKVPANKKSTVPIHPNQLQSNGQLHYRNCFWYHCCHSWIWSCYWFSGWCNVKYTENRH